MGAGKRSFFSVSGWMFSSGKKISNADCFRCCDYRANRAAFSIESFCGWGLGLAQHLFVPQPASVSP